MTALANSSVPEADVVNAMTRQNSGFSDDGGAKFTKVAEAV
jgi:hypothetical protein